jgi:hypothetical protein
MTVEELLERARSQVGLGIKYKMGGGTSKAARHTCADSNNACDCSSFVCWALGIDKNGNYPFLRRPGTQPDPGGDWYGTDQIWDDAVNLRLGLFSKVNDPIPGCVIVFPTTWKEGKAKPAGHCGIVTQVAGGKLTKLIHCSSGNFKAKGDAVQETDPDVFTDPRTIFAWCGRIDLPMVAGAVADLGLRAMAAVAFAQVRFIVVATGNDGAAILALAEEVAGDNPVGRRVVKRGDPDFPSAGQLNQLTGGAANSGAVVLRPEGTVFRVLTVQQAKNAATVARSFAFASGEEPNES